MNILDAMQDPELFGCAIRDRATWAGWRSCLAAIFGLAMTPEQLALYRECTGRAEPPTTSVREAWLVVGRRGGKSFVLALVAVFLACFHEWRSHLAPGERATVMVIAADRRQARVIMRYIKGLLQSVQMLARMVEAERQEAIDLTNRVTIEVHTASYRTVRGYTVVAALLDELAFWRGEDSANPDTEVLGALRPAMATVPGAVLLGASSPYARRGALWDAHRRHFGKDGPVLVWQAPTRTMNPTVPQRVVDEALEDDPAAAAAEYLAQFRTDVESFVSREAVEDCVDAGVRERAPLVGLRYVAFVDPSGGSSDSMTLAIGHREGDRAALDAVREVRPPFSPESVVSEFAQLLKAYRISKVRGDRYAGEWPREQFRKHGIGYEPADRPKSDLYRDCLPLINSGRVVLLDHSKLVNQFCSLERRTARSGRDSIDHAPGAHDDVANCIAGVLVELGTNTKGAYARALAAAMADVPPGYWSRYVAAH
jgi:hypothetical protein